MIVNSTLHSLSHAGTSPVTEAEVRIAISTMEKLDSIFPIVKYSTPIQRAFNFENNTIVRLGQLTCEPCMKNVCNRYGIPKCLTLLDEELITAEVLKYLQ